MLLNVVPHLKQSIEIFFVNDQSSNQTLISNILNSIHDSLLEFTQDQSSITQLEALRINWLRFQTISNLSKFQSNKNFLNLNHDFVNQMHIFTEYSEWLDLFETKMDAGEWSLHNLKWWDSVLADIMQECLNPGKIVDPSYLNVYSWIVEDFECILTSFWDKGVNNMLYLFT